MRRSERGPSGAAARWRTPQTWDDRLSDRCNAVLARDLTQAINGRGWTLATLGVSVVVGIVLLDGSPEGGAEAGRAMLTRLFGLLLLVLWFLVPFRTFTAMREEVTGETREHLLLSGLSAKSVVVGKVAAALLLALGQLGIVAPLLALAWAVGTGSFAGLSIALWVTLLGSLAWSTLAVGFGTLAPRFRPRALPIAAAGVAFAVIGGGAASEAARLLEDSEEIARHHFWSSALVAAIAAGLAVAIGFQLAAAGLGHAHANRSTGFRVVGLAMPLAIAAAAAIHAPTANRATELALLTFAVLVPFWLLGATEDREPASAGRRGSGSLALALLSPGRGRALAWALLVFGAVAAVGLAHAARPEQRIALGYAFGWSALGVVVAFALRNRRDALRDREPAGAARRDTLVGLLAAAAAPMIVNGIAGLRLDAWHVAHVVNPATTLLAIERGDARAAPAVAAGLATVGLLLQVPALLHGRPAEAVEA